VLRARTIRLASRLTVTMCLLTTGIAMREANGDVCNTEASAADRLVAAAQASDWEGVERLLLQAVDANCRDARGRTPLIAASTFWESNLTVREEV